MVSKPYARLRLKFAIQMARLIQRSRNGDTRLFDNMIDRNGKVLVTEAILRKHIKSISEEAKPYYPTTSRILLNWLH